MRIGCYNYAGLLFSSKEQATALRKYEAIWTSYKVEYGNSPKAMERAVKLQEVGNISDDSKQTLPSSNLCDIIDYVFFRCFPGKATRGVGKHA